MMDDPWSDDDDDILLSQAADKAEQSVIHETESDDDLILSQRLEQVEEHLQSVSNPHSSSFPESDDDDLILSQTLTETEKYLQTVANLSTSTGFPESDDDDLILSQSLTEAEGILQGDTNILRNGNSISRSAASFKSDSRQDWRDVNQNQASLNTLTHSQGSLKQSTETMFHGQSSCDAEVVNVSDDEDDTNTRSVETTAGSSESVAGPSDGVQHQKQVDEELQKQKKSLEQVKNTFDSELQCSICNELFVQATSLNCAHAFCALCIGQWLRTSRACPMCRTTVTSKTRSIALDNFIDKMCEHLGEGMKEDRQSLLETREREQAQFDASHGNQPNRSSSPTSPLIVHSEPDSLPDSPYYEVASPSYSPTYVPRTGMWGPTSPDYNDNLDSWSETSSSSDSLYSTDSSATDFSDHSPRSRQRRREMRQRERRSRHQRRRNRNTNSDSSMSYGRRIDWRRRMRSRSRRRRNERNKRRRDRRRRHGEETESSSDYSESDSSSDDQSRHGRRWRLERRSSHDRSRRDRDRDSSSDYSQSVSGGDNSGERASRDRNSQRSGRWRRIHSDSGDSNGSRNRYSRRRVPNNRGGTGRHRRRQRERDGSTSTERRRDRSRHLPRIISSDDDNVNNGGSGRENAEIIEQGSRQRTRTRTRRGSDQTENNEQASLTSRRSDRNEHANNGRTSGVGNNTSRSVMADGSSNRFGSARASRTSTDYENDNSTASTSRGTRPFSSQSPFTRPYYGGYGQCFKCGRSGHWANGCTYR